MDITLHTGKPEEAGMSKQKVRNILDSAKRWVDEGITSSLVVFAARKGVIVIHEAFGSLTHEQDSPSLSLDTIYRIASVSKPITAAMTMILVEDGLLSLNRPVSEYIPEFVGEGKSSVMVHHLLTHTSGLREENLVAHSEKKEKIVEIPPPDVNQHPIINKHLFLQYDAPLWKPPGTEMSYSGYNYELLGEIIRRISKKGLDDFARERIFEPLGMKDTYYIVPESVYHRIVRQQDAGIRLATDLGDSWVKEHWETPWARHGAYSTAMDMAIFGQMFLNQGIYAGVRILSPASIFEMTRNQIPGIGSSYGDEFFPEASWGFGWSVKCNKKSIDSGTLDSPKRFGHGGAGGVILWVDPVYETVTAYFSVALDENRTCKQSDIFINMVTASVVDI